jgi:hypothetical protein
VLSVSRHVRVALAAADRVNSPLRIALKRRRCVGSSALSASHDVRVKLATRDARLTGFRDQRRC